MSRDEQRFWKGPDRKYFRLRKLAPLHLWGSHHRQSMYQTGMAAQIKIYIAAGLFCNLI